MCDRHKGQSGTASATLFPELNDLLTEFVSVVRSVLAKNLVGVYLTGAFALGGGDAASDCDFLVVTAGRLSRDDERALRRLHERIPAWPSYWAYNFEGSYAPETDLRTLAGLGRPWLYVNRGGRGMEWSAHCNTEDVRWVLRERPLILDGPDPRAFACEIPATVRMLYTLERGEVISKPQALAWATRTMPAEWRDLIAHVREDRFVQWNDPPRPGSVERSLAFVAYVQKRARSSP